MAYNFKQYDAGMAEAVLWFTREIGALRAGRATPMLVEDIEVESYGTRTPLKHVAAIGVEDAKTITLKPWDKGMIPAIEAGIRASGIGLQPITDKDIVRVRLPELTEERRNLLKKTLKEKLEEAKIALRRSRDEVWSDVQEKERGGELTEDDKFRLKDEIQKKIDAAGAKLDELAKKKEEEISF
ncbi:MAG: ribosome recycling factor [Candidatus Niyogibacteria bacterium]|nr:ribosome recycling factor [Candidatus Niyogibacteria bacterium]